MIPSCSNIVQRLVFFLAFYWEICHDRVLLFSVLGRKDPLIFLLISFLQKSLKLWNRFIIIVFRVFISYMIPQNSIFELGTISIHWKDSNGYISYVQVLYWIWIRFSIYLICKEKAITLCNLVLSYFFLLKFKYLRLQIIWRKKFMHAETVFCDCLISLYLVCFIANHLLQI